MNHDSTNGPRPGDEGWMQVYGRREGHMIHPRHPHVSAIKIATIAHGLSLEQRWAAQTRVAYPVAMHLYRASLLIAEDDPETAFKVLNHDDVEGMGFRDLPGPIKNMPEMAFYRALERNWMVPVAEKLRLPIGFDLEPAVIAADRRMLDIEQREQLAPPPAGYEWGWWKNGVEPEQPRPVPRAMLAPTAKRLWLTRFAELADRTGRGDLADEARQALNDDVADELAWVASL